MYRVAVLISMSIAKAAVEALWLSAGKLDGNDWTGLYRHEGCNIKQTYQYCQL